ncbi:MAG: GntR family transcriptional regulator [Halioglobus sp.]|nr:GntR family transcriptional regulator [Halioglobus sp.]|tara:strand:- start:1798 stop:2487 length:690 start_codon:yes stop_codon:yes gene_type:complete
MEIQTIKVQRLYLQVAQQLQGLIESGAIEVGARLPSERDLASQFGVSRPTVREAMIALEIAGLVEVRSGSGVYVLARPDHPGRVAQMQGPGPFEILEARRLIEGETCALAAQRIDAQQLARLQELVDEMAEENRREVVTEQADEAFHCLVAEAAGNSALAATVTWLWRLRNESEISTHFHRRVRAEGNRPIVADHQAILDALRAGDPQAARQAMSGHLQRVIDQLLEAR